jgi:Gram-negative bacterial TonB protein C-terminal
VKQYLVRGLLLTSLAISTSWCVGQQTASSQGQAVLVALSKPTFSQGARIANVEGTVIVSVTIRPDGTIESTSVRGLPLLKQAALDSATQSRFECRLCSAPRSYTLVYNFKRTSQGNCCDGIGAAVEVQEQPPSHDEQGQPQTMIAISTERICLCDPGPTFKMRSVKCLYLWKCSTRP